MVKKMHMQTRGRNNKTHKYKIDGNIIYDVINNWLYNVYRYIYCYNYINNCIINIICDIVNNIIYQLRVDNIIFKIDVYVKGNTVILVHREIIVNRWLLK